MLQAADQGQKGGGHDKARDEKDEAENVRERKTTAVATEAG